MSNGSEAGDGGSGFVMAVRLLQDQMGHSERERPMRDQIDSGSKARMGDGRLETACVVFDGLSQEEPSGHTESSNQDKSQS